MAEMEHALGANRFLIEAMVSDAVGEVLIGARWSMDRVSHYHPGWLRAHRYDGYGYGYGYGYGGPRPPEPTGRRLWDATADADLPVFDWSTVEGDPTVRLAFLTSVRSFGLALLVDGPTSAAEFQRRIHDIFLIRNMNWGMFFDVVCEPGGKYISNKGINIVPHVDAPTREYQIGLMCFHCLVVCLGFSAVDCDGSGAPRCIASRIAAVSGHCLSSDPSPQ